MNYKEEAKEEAKELVETFKKMIIEHDDTIPDHTANMIAIEHAKIIRGYVLFHKRTENNFKKWKHVLTELNKLH